MSVSSVYLEGLLGIVPDDPMRNIIEISYVLDALVARVNGLSESGAGSGVVESVFGRSGVVTAQAGDYTAAQVTNAVSTAGSYADPAWITSLAWSKITGKPSVSSYQTPWLSDIDGAGFRLLNTGNVGIGTSNPRARL
jgi:hypothetical protein